MNVQLGTAIAAPGSRATGWLAIETAPGEQTQIPVVVINGGQPGPRLAITAGIHGGEYTGPAALRSLLLSGGLLAFALSFDEVIVTLFAAGPGARTLPVWVFSELQRSYQLPVVNVVALLLVLVSVVPVWIAQRIGGGEIARGGR